MSLPTFLIIGAPKAGTTTLHYALSQHPEVFMCPLIEAGFFWAYGQQIRLHGPGAEKSRNRLVTRLDEYQKLFKDARQAKAIGESSVRVWQASVHAGDAAFLREHRVHGAVVLPLAAYVDLALAAGSDAGWPAPMELHDLAIDRAMVFDRESPRTVQVVLSSQEDGIATLEIFSRDPLSAEQQWVRHASASLATAPGGAPTPVSIAALVGRTPATMAPEELYRLLAALGLQYGPAMRRVDAIHRGP